MTSCAQALRLVINQRLVPSTDGKWTPLREFPRLRCGPIGSAWPPPAPDDWPQITAEALENQWPVLTPGRSDSRSRKAGSAKKTAEKCPSGKSG